MKLSSFAMGEWQMGQGDGRPVFHAVSGDEIARVTSDGLDFQGMLDYGRRVGSPKLRAMTIHERALMLKAIALYLNKRKDELYQLSYASGATKKDCWVDVDGGIGTFFVYSGKGRRDFPNETFYVDGPAERISREGTFTGRHICVPKEGVAVHINAFNFPCWGMMEKLAANFIAGMPAIVKPATVTSYITRRCVELIIESGLLPEGALQIICGGVGDMFDHFTGQDVVTFTGSAYTGRKLRRHSSIIDNSVRFNMEADSLNLSILGPDATPDTDEFKLFIKEVGNEMTIKTGQRCTAIRRTFVPANMVDDVVAALKERLDGAVIGDPMLDGVRVGPLVGRDQVDEVWEKVNELKTASEIVYGGDADFEPRGGDKEKGAFFPSTLLYCNKPFDHSVVHDVEAFGPVNTIMPYEDLDGVIELAKRGQGSLCGSMFTNDDAAAKKVVLGTAAYHGRLLMVNRFCAKENTGHGSPLPHLVHGGPGRAGGGEEMGGYRGAMLYMQRTAIQGSPTTLTHICNEYTPGGERTQTQIHPFRKHFEELQVGEVLVTHKRTVTEADIVNFGCVSGDHFYAHFDETASEGSLFGKRVAHGYFIISAAAGMFVDPAPGPVLANYGMDTLRFIEPVGIGDTIQVKLTCMRKTDKKKREPDDIPQGIVHWDVEVTNQIDEIVASYTILTLVKKLTDD